MEQALSSHIKEAGEVGAFGTTGTTGTTGSQGSQGTSGIDGVDGANGSTGPQGPEGPQGPTGASGANGSGIAGGGTTGQALVKSSNVDYEVEWSDVATGSGGTYYCVRAEYTSTQALGGCEFIDPSGSGVFETSNATIGTRAGDNQEFSFSGQNQPPRAILVYAYQANNSRYVITHLDGGGNNASFYAQGITESAHTSNFSIGNQVTTDLFTNFSAAKIKLDLSMGNIDAVRNAGGFGQTTKEAHAFIIFKF